MSRTTFVKVFSFSIAKIFRSFINLFGILIDKCAFSDIFYQSSFLHMSILVFVIMSI